MSSINKFARVALRFPKYSVLHRTNKLLFFIPNDPRYKEPKINEHSYRNSWMADFASGLCVAGTVSFVTGVAVAIVNIAIIFCTDKDYNLPELCANCFYVSFIMYICCAIFTLLS